MNSKATKPAAIRAFQNANALTEVSAPDHTLPRKTDDNARGALQQAQNLLGSHIWQSPLLHTLNKSA